jgi:dephospho-CoA kinase
MIGFKKYLEERLIIVGGGKKYGQIVWMAGGAGSGKGFAQKHFLEGDKFKVRDVDEYKRQFLELSRIKGKYPEIANLNLKNPDDVAVLHAFVKRMGVKDKSLELLFADVKQDRLPNIIFDVTLKGVEDIYEVLPKLLELGYRHEDLHIVWVLTPVHQALENNAKRARTVKPDLLVQIHDLVAKTMTMLISHHNEIIGPQGVDGAIYVVNGDPHASKKVKSTITDFEYYKVKSPGKPVDPTQAAKVAVLVDKRNTLE